MPATATRRRPPTKSTTKSAPTRTRKSPPARTKRRVEETPPKLHMASAGLSGKQANISNVKGTAMKLDDGVLVSAFFAETVPVAQFANVVLGPVGLQWKLGDINMEDLIDVDWGDWDEDTGDHTFDRDALTPRQAAAYDRVRGAVRATMKVVGYAVAEDRESVELSVRLYNKREAELAAQEAAVKAAKPSAKKATSRRRARARS